MEQGGYTADQVRQLARRAFPPPRRGRKTGLMQWCEANGVSRTPLINFLSGERPNPPQDVLRALGLERRYGPKS
jgi:hypothetical protein